MKPIKRLVPIFSILLAGCFSDGSDEEFEIHPDLTIGNSWKYLHRQYSKAENGVFGDTLIYFIRYEITGDTVIGDSTYRLLEETDLVVVDSSLRINRTLNAVRSERGRIVIKQLKGGEPTLGRYPLKAGAASFFDTVNFEDEVVALSFPIRKNSEWRFRQPGHPFGHSPVKKIFLGVEAIEIAGEVRDAMKFAFLIEDMEWSRSFEWYSESFKLKSYTASAVSVLGDDSAFFEEEYLDGMEFTRADSQTVMDSYLEW